MQQTFAHPFRQHVQVYSQMLQKNKSFKLYQLYSNGKLPENIKVRCCNFKLLEKKCVDYNK